MNRDDKLSPVAVVYDAMGEWSSAEKKETVHDVLTDMKAHEFKYLGTVWADRIERRWVGILRSPKEFLRCLLIPTSVATELHTTKRGH